MSRDSRARWSRRATPRLAGSGLVAGLAGCADLLGTDSGAWPTFQADVANTGHLDETSPTEFADERWRFETGFTVSASPAVVGGTLYVGSGDDHAYALA